MQLSLADRLYVWMPNSSNQQASSWTTIQVVIASDEKKSVKVKMMDVQDQEMVVPVYIPPSLLRGVNHDKNLCYD